MIYELGLSERGRPWFWLGRRMSGLWSAGLVLAAAVSSVWPASLYVSPEGTHQAPFGDWNSAATNILSALREAAAGDTVWVTNGIYVIDRELAVRDGVALRSVNGPEVTIVDGRDEFRCLHLQGNQALAEGLTIRNGRSDFGAGVRFGVGGILRNCLVTQNVATNSGGGGIYVRWNGLVENCRITGNSAPAGQGGGACFLSGGTLRNSFVLHNEARVAGGVGLLFHARMENCLVASNVATQAGGVLCSQRSLVLNSTITQNQATAAGGLHGFYGGEVWNSIVFGNSAFRGPNYSSLDSADNRLQFFYSCARPLPAGEGNLESEPSWANEAAGDFRLALDSPCLDAGYDARAPADDLLGNARPQDGNGDGTPVVDMGAYEYAP